MQKLVLFAFSLLLTLNAFADNHPPVIFPNLTVPLRARAIQRVNLADKKYSMDPDGDPLTFSWAGTPPAWMALLSDGTLEARPAAAQVGKHVFSFSVSDGKATTQEEITFEVSEFLATLEWKQNPILLEPKDIGAISESLVKYVNNPGGLPLAFTLLQGPAWAKISTDGILSTTQTPPNGTHRITLIVKSGNEKLDGGEIKLTIKGIAPVAKPLMYHIVMLADMPDALNCSLMKRGIDELIISSLNAARLTRVVLKHGCNNLNQYYGRVIGEGLSQQERDSLYAIAKHYHGSFLMEHEMLFQLVQRIELFRSLVLSDENNQPIYKTGYNAPETFYSMKKVADVAIDEHLQITKGTHESLLGFFQSQFPTKSDELGTYYAKAKRYDFYYGVKLYMMNQPTQAFVFFRRDINP